MNTGVGINGEVFLGSLAVQLYLLVGNAAVFGGNGHLVFKAAFFDSRCLMRSSDVIITVTTVKVRLHRYPRFRGSSRMVDRGHTLSTDPQPKTAGCFRNQLPSVWRELEQLQLLG